VPKLYVLSFLLAFYKHIVISELNKVLRPIMLDGQFSKRENRTLFTESYNDLMKIEHDIQMFEAKIAPTGELGKQYEAAQTDMSVTSRRRKIQNIQDAADELADTIVSNSRNAIQNLLTVLQAIENHDSEGRNDMLVNTSKFIGKAPLEILGTNNAPPVPAALTPKGLAFFNGIKDAINTLKQSSQIMDNIDTMGSL
jgi:glutamine synthetase adenylyltransferase